MKTALLIHNSPHRPTRTRRGSAVVVLLVLLAVMLALAAANAVTLKTLRQRVQMIDHLQTHRLVGASATPPRTNAPGVRTEK